MRQVKGKGLLTRLIFGLAFRWKQFRIHMGSPVESVSLFFTRCSLEIV